MSTAGHKQAVAYRPDIDGLRAIAVLAVVLFHAHLPFVHGGYVGVDVFFVISGFLITAILLQDASIVRFYQRRARRILPALFALVIVTLLLGLLLFLPHDLVSLARSTASTLLFGSNVWFWRQSGYFAAETELWPMLHTWSLGVEEQFYIAFPLIVAVFSRWPRLRLAILFAVLALGSLAVAIYLMSHAKAVMAFYLAPMRAWELLIGSILATAVVPRPHRALVRTVAAGAGLAGILGSVVFYSPGTSFPGLGALPPVLGSALVIWAGTGGTHPLGRLLGCAPLRAIGLISYSLYLWHWPVLAFARYWAVDPLGPWQTLAAVLIALAAATLSWRFVERPFRRGFADRTIWLLSAAGIGALLAATFAIIALGGLPKRFSPAVVALNAEEGETWRCPVTDMFAFDGYYACKLALPSRQARDAQVVLWGDSHAQMYAPALIGALGARTAMLVNAYGCAPVMGDGADPTCAAVQSANFRRIVALPARTVILAQNWPQYRDEAGVRLGRDPRPEERYQDALRRLTALVGGLRAAGKRVIVVGPVPLPRYHIASVAARDLAFRGRVRTPLEVSRAAYLTENANILAVLDRLARDQGVVILRPDTLACDARRCPFVFDGHAAFADHGHYATSFTRRFTPLFATALDAADARR